MTTSHKSNRSIVHTPLPLFTQDIMPPNAYEASWYRGNALSRQRAYATTMRSNSASGLRRACFASASRVRRIRVTHVSCLRWRRACLTRLHPYPSAYPPPPSMCRFFRVCTHVHAFRLWISCSATVARLLYSFVSVPMCLPAHALHVSALPSAHRSSWVLSLAYLRYTCGELGLHVFTLARKFTRPCRNCGALAASLVLEK